MEPRAGAGPNPLAQKLVEGGAEDATTTATATSTPASTPHREREHRESGRRRRNRDALGDEARPSVPELWKNPALLPVDMLVWVLILPSIMLQ